MSKQELIAAVAAAVGVSKKTAGEAIEALTDVITKELKKGKNVTLTGFGTFRLSKRAARTGVNPRHPTQRIKIPPMNIPAFKAGKSLKDAVR
ncbi:HU family DNA-binding protein [Candidatus Peregrinibacteria bacterium]|nr:HU family DNA-binding protein [Candidatus Peregrinibacteria bacterium]